LDLAIDQRGYAWFATDKGVDIWDGVTMRSYGFGTGLPGNEFRKLFAEDDAMWVGTDQGLLRYHWLQWNVIISGTSVNDIARDKEDGLLLGTDEGLVLYDGSQSFQWMITLDGRIIKDLQVTALSVDRRGDLWVGTAQDGLFHYDRQTWEQFDTTRGMPTNTIRTIFTDRQRLMKM
jgi:ligand-binding sensor domain-containing protein